MCSFCPTLIPSLSIFFICISYCCVVGVSCCCYWPNVGILSVLFLSHTNSKQCFPINVGAVLKGLDYYKNYGNEERGVCS